MANKRTSHARTTHKKATPPWIQGGFAKKGWKGEKILHPSTENKIKSTKPKAVIRNGRNKKT